LQTPNLEEGEIIGVGNGTVRKSVGEFLWALHNNFSSIFMRFIDIAAFVLQHPTFSLPHVPLGIGGSPFGYKERRCWANSPRNYFPRFPTYVITDHKSPTSQTDSQTDRQTNGRHAIARPRSALKCINAR